MPNRRCLLLAVPVLVLLGFGLSTSPGQTPSADSDLVTNGDILELTRAGVTPAIIITKIRGSRCKFSLDTPALVELKTARVNDDVVQAMLDCAPGRDLAPSPGDDADVRVFLLDQGPAGRTALIRAHVNQGLRMGWFSWGNQVVLPGKHASTRCPAGTPVFVFEFSDSRESPAGWILTKLDSTDEGEGRRIDGDSAHPVVTQLLRPGSYQVAPKKRLKRGEYAFYKGQIQSGIAVPSGYPGSSASLVVYDFGLD